MYMSQTQVKTAKKPSKLVIGITAAAITALVSSVGVASASQPPKHNNNNNNNKPGNSEICSRQSACVKNQATNRGGGGYYGNIRVGVSPHITINGNNNIINLIVNVLFG